MLGDEHPLYQYSWKIRLPPSTSAQYLVKSSDISRLHDLSLRLELYYKRARPPACLLDGYH